jgi:hypothetical protein
MDQQKIDDIIAKVAKEHSIILNRNDPILAVMTANEVIFEDFLLMVEKAYEHHMCEIEGMTAKYIADTKQLAQGQIGAAVKETFSVLEEYHKKALFEIETATKTATNGLLVSNAQVQMNYWLIVGGSIASILIGIFIGKIF